MISLDSNAPLRLNGWERAYLPVIHGLPPMGTISLSALADADQLDRLVPSVASNISSDHRQAAITIIHYAVGAVTEILLMPLVLDGVTIQASADQLGIVLGDDRALIGFWAGPDIGVHYGELVTQSGNQLSALLRPIVATVQARESLSRRGLDLVLFDAIWRGCKRLNNLYAVKMDRNWVEDLLNAMGDSRSKKPRTFTVQADEGEPVEMVIPRVCCVLATHSTPHACPTCPLHSGAARRQYTEIWLRSLDEDGFHAETGRKRIISNVLPPIE